jgi:hypothetical protein
VVLKKHLFPLVIVQEELFILSWVGLAFEKGTCNMFAVKIISKKKFSIGGKTPIVSSLLLALYLVFLVVG